MRFRRFEHFELKLFLAFVLLLQPKAALAVNEVVNAEALRQHYGLSAYLSSSAHALRDVKIAVLDNGFEGFQPGRGLLPESAEPKNLTSIGAASTSHGLGMAQIIWAMTGKNPEGPKFFLVNTNGFSNFKAAVQFVIDEKVDLVLYSQVWPFGSNFDGRGFINAQVTRAIQNGVIWVNAAGNHGGMVNNGFIGSERESFLGFQGGRDYLRFENKLDENAVSITLSWSDFTESEEYNATKDLDLLVFDSAGKQIASSEMVQRGEAPPPGGGSNLSSHAREVIQLKNLDRGQYQIKIRIQSNNFSAQDRFRVLLKAEKGGGVVFTDRSTGGEILPPADHPMVITVGERSAASASGPTADNRVKPEIFLDETRVSFSNGVEAAGTSVAAALFAGVVAVLKADFEGLSLEKLRGFIGHLSPAVSFPDLVEITPLEAGIGVSRYIPAGGKVAKHVTERRFVILAPQDPFMLPEPRSVGIRRVRSNDILIVSPHDGRWYGLPFSLREKIKYPWIEFRETGDADVPTQTVQWRTPVRDELRRF